MQQSKPIISRQRILLSNTSNGSPPAQRFWCERRS